MPKATNKESLERTEAVKKLLLEGYHSNDIVQYCAKTWGLRSRQAHTYIKKAFKAFHDEFKADNALDVDFHLSARLEIYRKAVKAGHWKTALRALEDISKIRGHYATGFDEDRPITAQFTFKVLEKGK